MDKGQVVVKVTQSIDFTTKQVADDMRQIAEAARKINPNATSDMMFAAILHGLNNPNRREAAMIKYLCTALTL